MFKLLHALRLELSVCREPGASKKNMESLISESLRSCLTAKLAHLKTDSSCTDSTTHTSIQFLLQHGCQALQIRVEVVFACSHLTCVLEPCYDVDCFCLCTQAEKRKAPKYMISSPYINPSPRPIPPPP